MNYYAGLDVSLEETAICVVDEMGRLVKETRAASEPQALIAALSGIGLPLERIGLEACSLAAWLHDDLRDAGLPAICIETRQANAAMKTMPNKTDRNDARALAQMAKSLRSGFDAAFTIDGPRGPRFVAKRGSVLLARSTGAAILCFHIAVAKAYIFRKTWDLTQFPCPFSRAAIFIAPPIFVSKDSSAEELERQQQEVQAALDLLRQRGEAWLAAGSPFNQQPG